MPLQNSWVIDYVNSRIYRAVGAAVDIVRDLYRWIMDEMDEQGAMDNTIPMTAQTPTEYTMVNNWFIDQESINYLKEGAIKTDGYNGQIQVIVMQSGGYVDCILGDIGLTVHDVGETDYGELLCYNNTLRKWWVRNTVQLPAATAFHIHAGWGQGTSTGASVTGEDLHPNVYTLGGIVAGSKVYVCQNGSKISPDWWGTGHIDILIKVKEAGTFIDGGKITVYIRDYTDLYSHYETNLSAGGRNPVAMSTSDDSENQTAIETVVKLLGTVKVHFVNYSLTYKTEAGANPAVGLVVRSTTNGGTGYILEWTGGSKNFKLGDKKGVFVDNDALLICDKLKVKEQLDNQNFYEGATITGLVSGKTAIVRRLEQITGGTTDDRVSVLWLTDATGAFTDGEWLQIEAVSVGKADGTQTTNTFTANADGAGAVALTINKDMNNGFGPAPYNVIIDCNAETVAELYEYCKALCRRTQAWYDMFPVYDGANISIVDGEQYQAARSTYAQKTASPLGTFAGGKFFGARGVWIEDMAGTDNKNYSLVDANNVTQNPPNLQSFVVSSMVATDRVIICLTTGDNYIINKSQYTVVAHAAGLDYVEVNEVIPDDTPANEVIRVRYNVGLATEGEDIYAVSSLDKPAKKFMIVGVTARQYFAEARAYAPYMDRPAAGDTETVTVTYGVNRFIICRVRKKGIIPFQTKGTFGASGYSVSAIRTEDPVAT